MSSIEKRRDALKLDPVRFEPLPPYVHDQKTRHGKRVLYFRRRPGAPRVRIVEQPGTPEFTRRYHELMARSANNALSFAADKPHDKHLGAGGAGSIGAMAKDYFASETFERLEPHTARQRRQFIEQCLRTSPGRDELGNAVEFADFAIDHVSKDTARALRKALKYERTATGRPLKAGGNLDSWRDVRMWAMRALFSWAIDAPHRWVEGERKRFVTGNPFQRLGNLWQDSGGHRTWTMADCAKMEAWLRKHERWDDLLAYALMRYTIVRRSDVVRLGAEHLDAHPGCLTFIEWKGSQSKTERRQRKERIIKLKPELRRIIEATPGALQRPRFVVGTRGSDLTDDAFGTRFNWLCREAGLPKGCTCHGIRKGVATNMAHKRASAHEIKAMGGWKSLRNVMRYTEAADDARLTETALDYV